MSQMPSAAFVNYINIMSRSCIIGIEAYTDKGLGDDGK
jgi:hypothetical protein